MDDQPDAEFIRQRTHRFEKGNVVVAQACIIDVGVGFDGAPELRRGEPFFAIG